MTEVATDSPLDPTYFRERPASPPPATRNDRLNALGEFLSMLQRMVDDAYVARFNHKKEIVFATLCVGRDLTLPTGVSRTESFIPTPKAFVTPKYAAIWAALIQLGIHPELRPAAGTTSTTYELIVSLS